MLLFRLNGARVNYDVPQNLGPGFWRSVYLCALLQAVGVHGFLFFSGSRAFCTSAAFGRFEANGLIDCFMWKLDFFLRKNVLSVAYTDTHSFNVFASKVTLHI